METIYRGYEFSFEVEIDDPAISGMSMRLFNKATQTSTKGAHAGRNAQGKFLYTISVNQTAQLPVGIYDLEFYNIEPPRIIRYVENFARCVMSAKNDGKDVK